MLVYSPGDSFNLGENQAFQVDSRRRGFVSNEWTINTGGAEATGVHDACEHLH